MMEDRSADVSLYVVPTAPLIGIPERYHWYTTIVPCIQVPGLAVKSCPTRVVPVIVGMDPMRIPGAIAVPGREA